MKVIVNDEHEDDSSSSRSQHFLAFSTVRVRFEEFRSLLIRIICVRVSNRVRLRPVFDLVASSSSPHLYDETTTTPCRQLCKER